MEEHRVRWGSNEAVNDHCEICALNACAVSFDLDQVEIEELERRFEMALALASGVPGACSGCPHLVVCGTFCSPPPGG